MLHGDGGTQGLGLVMYGNDVRKASETMPGPYGLLPSSAYFAHVGNPVTTFSNDDIAGPFSNAFPNGIASFPDLFSFVTDTLGLDAGVGDEKESQYPTRARKQSGKQGKNNS